MAIPRNLANIAPHVNASSTELVVNDAGADLNFRVEGDTDANTLFVDAGNNRVGIGTATPLDKLNVQADSTTSPSSGNLAPIVVSGATSSNKRLLIGFNTTDNQGYVQAVEHTVDYRALTLNPQGGAVLVNKTTTTANGGDLQVSKGITFPATQSASTDANTLDDYEEGTWTPSVGGTATYTDRAGSYTKIGDLVYINCQIDINTIGTGSTTTISGLPFTSKTGTNRYAGSINYFASLASNAINLLVWNQNNTTSVKFSTVTTSGTGLSSDEASILGNGSWVQFSMCYKAS